MSPRRRRRCRRRPWAWASKGALLAAWARPACAQRPRSARRRCRWPALAHAGLLHKPCPAQLDKSTLCAHARPAVRRNDSSPPRAGPGRTAARPQPTSARNLDSWQSRQHARAAMLDMSGPTRAPQDNDCARRRGCTCGCSRGAAAARRLSASASASACRSVSPTARAHAAQHQPRQAVRSPQRPTRSCTARQRLPGQPHARAAAQLARKAGTHAGGRPECLLRRAGGALLGNPSRQPPRPAARRVSRSPHARQPSLPCRPPGRACVSAQQQRSASIPH